MYHLRNISTAGVVGFVQEVPSIIEGIGGMFIDILPPMSPPPNTSTAILCYLDGAAFWKYWATLKPMPDIKLPPEVEQMWLTRPETKGCFTVTIDSQNNVFTGGWDNKVTKLSPNGDVIWNFTGTTNVVQAIVVDKHDNIYSAANDCSVRKISQSGAQIWSNTSNVAAVISVAVGDDLNVYSGGDDSTIRKISPTGTLIWTYSCSGGIRMIAVDNQGNVYGGGYEKTVRKLSPAGSLIWTFTGHTNIVQTVAVDKQGNVYSGGTDGTIRKISQNGKQIWASSEHGVNVRSIIIDDENNVYSCGDSRKIIKLSPAGEVIYSYPIATVALLEKLAINNDGNICVALSDGYLVQYQQNYGTLILNENPVEIKKIYKLETITKELPADSSQYQIWSVALTAESYSYVTDKDDNLYCTVGTNILKFDKKGDKIWEVTFSNFTGIRLDIDRQNNIYAGTNNKFCKISPNGVILFELEDITDLFIRSFKVDLQNNIYIAFISKILKFSANGTVISEVGYRNASIEFIDKQGFVYLCSTYAEDSSLSKYFPSLLDGAWGVDGSKCVVDNNGCVYVPYGNLTKYSPLKVKIYEKTGITGVTGLATDNLNNLYVKCAIDSKGAILKLDSAGNEVWRQNIVRDYSNRPVNIDTQGNIIFATSAKTINKISNNLSTEKIAYFN